MAYRPVFVMSSGERATNAQVRFRVWTLPVDYSTEMCEGPVNYVRVNGRDERKVNDY